MYKLRDRYIAYYFSSPNGALEKMYEIDVEMIIADVIMPEMNGFELLQIVRERYPSAVRVLLTGNIDKEKFIIGQDLSHFFLWKPVRFEALQTVFRFLENKPYCLGIK